ncbi:SUKH-4 family immunity protein [Streptomyces avicenniae]|uniref:SUKH-4 family immunity protein n=1 Tax=Streptomyces avicenniae TaxID=500153 RepID=UPI00069A3921|nr:SUKH-4 family immunity protein [Streptomyces avicenniae]
MSFAILRAELESAFGTGRLVAIPDGRLNPLVTHPQTRRFLAEVGLPVVEGFAYEPLEYLAVGLPNAVDGDPEFSGVRGLPETAGHWVLLGYCFGDLIYLDGATGLLWELIDGTVVNSRVDLFTRSLLVLFRRWDDFAEGVPNSFRDSAAEKAEAEIQAVDRDAVDPEPLDQPERFWSRILETLATYG